MDKFPVELQQFIDRLDESGERLREVLDRDTGDETPAIQFYLQGAAFLEAGYQLVEQLGIEQLQVLHVFIRELYLPLFEKADRGQMGWGEALNGLPQFLRDFAVAKVEEDLLSEVE